MPAQATLEAFKARLRGELLQANDAGYETARKVYNGMIDRHPRLIVRCANVADVIAAVHFARDNDMLVAVRGGGHNGGGLGTCDDGLVIDLSRMKGIRVDPVARTVRVEGGCTWGDVDHTTHAFGLATPSGIISTTGVGGLTLGGGLGHLTRKCGLSIDNLLAVDMILADGRLVTASAEEYTLTCSGEYAVAVATLASSPHSCFGCTRSAPSMPGRCSGHSARQPRSCSGTVSLSPRRRKTSMASFRFPDRTARATLPGTSAQPDDVWYCVVLYRQPEQAEATFKPIRSFRPPALDLVGPLPHPALQGMFDALYPPGLQWYWRADFVNELSDAAIALHVKYGSEIPTLHSTMHLYPINGAAHRVGKHDTAWSYRDATWAQVIVGCRSRSGKQR